MIGDREGVRVKRSIFYLFEMSPLGGTEASYRMSKLIFVKTLLHIEVWDFCMIPCKNGQNWHFVIFLAKPLKSTFNFFVGDFKKNGLKMPKLGPFSWECSIKSPILKIFSKALQILFLYTGFSLVGGWEGIPPTNQNFLNPPPTKSQFLPTKSHFCLTKFWFPLGFLVDKEGKKKMS